MVVAAVCEYVLALLNVRVKDTIWKIEKMRAALLPSMVVTRVPRDLACLEACHLSVRLCEWRAPLGEPKCEKWENERGGE